MDQKEKKSKKEFISRFIDLANGRFKDSEIDLLMDLVNNRDKYSGLSKTKQGSYDAWCSEGKYTRNEKTTYTLNNGDEGISVKEKYSVSDDDGTSWSRETTYKTAREILGVIGKLLDH